MNNKGMTLVELIITFSLLMVIIVGMFNLILNAKLDLDDKQLIKEVTEYSDFINNDIHYDLITKKPVAIAIKKTASSAWTCVYNTRYSFEEDCAINNSTFSVNITRNEQDQVLNITGNQSVANICNNYYPCAVYAYYDSKNVGTQTSVSAKFKTIALNKKKAVGDGCGIKYGNSFEKLPSQNLIDTREMKAKIALEDDFLVIEYPIYITGNNTNYGFKIAYPYDEKVTDIEDDSDLNEGGSTT